MYTLIFPRQVYTCTKVILAQLIYHPSIANNQPSTVPGITLEYRSNFESLQEDVTFHPTQLSCKLRGWVGVTMREN